MARSAALPAWKPSSVACVHCAQVFLTVRDGQRSCGKSLCFALEHWDADRWEGAARMARIRHSIDLPLNDMDQEALRRA